MCQCVVCDCCWWNCFGACCVGWHMAFCCASCWICKPIEMSNPSCCSICNCTGCGEIFFCVGHIWCAPDYVKDYSRFRNGDGGNVIVVNQTTPMTQYWNDCSISSYVFLRLSLLPTFTSIHFGFIFFNLTYWTHYLEFNWRLLPGWSGGDRSGW